MKNQELQDGTDFFEGIQVKIVNSIINEIGQKVKFSWGDGTSQNQCEVFPLATPATFKLQIPVCNSISEVRKYRIRIDGEGTGRPVWIWLGHDLKLRLSCRKAGGQENTYVYEEGIVGQELGITTFPTGCPCRRTSAWVIGVLEDTEQVFDRKPAMPMAQNEGKQGPPKQYT